MNLIANTGIHFFSFPLEFKRDDKFMMYFHEWFDIADQQLKLEIAHKFEDEIWVSKLDLKVLGYLRIKDERVNGKLFRRGTVEPQNWEEIRKDFQQNQKQKINIDTELPDDSGCFTIGFKDCKWDKFENKWFPFPFFYLGKNDKTEFGPLNWCRFKLIPDTKSEGVSKYSLLLAFDTKSKYEEEDFEDEYLMETPVFSGSFDTLKSFSLCNDEFQLIDFCSKSKNADCEWINNYILKHYHQVNQITELNVKKPKLSYLAQYIYILSYIRSLDILKELTLFSAQKIAPINVDLVIDMGNSRTCAILFDDGDFTKVESLFLQNFTKPVKDGNLNFQRDSFDMRLAFRAVDFGENLLEASTQFIYPGMVRLGNEAQELLHNAIVENLGNEKVTTFSSPKRYLWDKEPQSKEWEFTTLSGEKTAHLWIKGISQQLNADGSLNIDGSGGVSKFYSRKTLMTLAFIEILAQAFMQINSFRYRERWGSVGTSRKIGRVIVTCPTAMSRVEQIALRRCAEDASIILRRFFEERYLDTVDEKQERAQTRVIPSAQNFLNPDEPKEWIYDEATCAQFVYLYAEIKERYLKHTKEFFDFYGTVRKDLGNYSKKSLTIGSVDLGAGTTDMMIASYKYEDAGECSLTPVPLYWESFYLAGDDLMKELIRQTVIEGKNGAVFNKLIQLGRQRDNIQKLILDFFGPDNARQSVKDRQVRSEFNLQISVPVVCYFLELLKNNENSKYNLGFKDIFKGVYPSDRVLNHFSNHFGFRVEDIEWNYDKTFISNIVERTFDSLVGKISVVLSYYGCDIVLLSGRPSSLKPLSDLFYKYCAVSPNRLITMSDYKIGTWYPFQDGRGYFKDAKSIVAVGAMIGNYASSRGSLGGFSLNLSELYAKMGSTAEYFAKTEKSDPFITPGIHSVSLNIAEIPSKFWCRQLDTPNYPTRPFYKLSFNFGQLKSHVISRYSVNENDEKAIKLYLDQERERLIRLAPFTVQIDRENYPLDKETLNLISIVDKNGDNHPVKFFSLQVQSMAEDENYWLDSGEFINL